MYDSFKRNITYLRISVTDRCNLACTYCMPNGPATALASGNILSSDEIRDVVHTLAPLGINKIRLTGGEPLLRADIVSLVDMIARVPGITDLALTTNGQRLDELAYPLASAGLNRVNVSLDTLDPGRYRDITGGGDLRKVLKGIAASRDAGLSPLKINCVRTSQTREEDLNILRTFCRNKGLEFRLIRQMDLSSGRFWKVEGGLGGQCASCNRIRLTADGRFLPCLFSEREYHIRHHGIRKAFELALKNKPSQGKANRRSSFYLIGG